MAKRITHEDIKEAVSARDVFQLAYMRRQLSAHISVLSGKLNEEPPRIPDNCKYDTYEEWETKARQSLRIMESNLELIEVGMRTLEA